MKRLLPFILVLSLAGCSTKQAQVDTRRLDPGIEPYDVAQPRDLPMVGAGGTFRLHADKTAKSPIVAGDIFFVEDSAANWATKYATAADVANYVLSQINTEAAFESRLFTLPEGGTGSVAGTDTQVQINDGGVVGADSGLTYNKTTNELTVTGSISTPYITTSATNGTYYGDFYNTVPITATATIGRVSGYGSRLHWADGTDWDDYFLQASDLGILAQGYDTDLTVAAGMGSAGNSKYFGTNSSGVSGIYDLPAGGGGIDYVSSDPASPATGDIWYNSTDHAIRVREAGGVTEFTGSFTADPAGSAAFESIAVGVDDTFSGTISTSTSLAVPEDGLIVVAVGGSVGAGDTVITGITCGSNTLVKGEGIIYGGSGYTFDGWYLENAVAYTGTCTATFNDSAAYRGIVAAAYSGITTTSALDKVTCNSAGCDSLTGSTTDRTATNTATTSQADELLVALEVSWDADHTYTGANGYTRRTAASGVHWSLLDKVVSATGAYPGGNFATVNTADSYLSIFMTFKVAP